MTTVLLARHGETPWNREGRIQGWAATGLTDRGREQARALGEWLSAAYDVDRVVASDLYRTRETAAYLRERARDLPEPTFDRGWRERGFGVYQGFLDEELFARHPDHDPATSVSSLDIDPEGGESVTAFCERVESAWADLRATVGAEETVLVVTHGGPLKALRSVLTDRDRAAALASGSPPNCAVTAVRLGETTELLEDGHTAWRDG
ncbi:histidine phosphatase family protein [Haloarcula marina]|uniref:histidine phosphatase family protein n=1 Tax=Haloarcula marina TaxID=2961574 RepID=UPI0020B6E715|nr:histidine phosphatase family protein [Halomicroarcula marina]